ncbi:MAG: pitrilysin family protein [Patescibacteria group bacterium]
MRYEIKVGKPLANGFRYYSQYDPSNSANLAGIAVKAGSIHSPPNLVGLPHLVEHVVARESLKYDRKKVELMTLAQGGPDGDINIRIDRISTFYGFESFLKRKNMLIYFDMLAHLVHDNIVSREGVDIEKAAVKNEYFLREQDYMPGLLDSLVHEAMYAENPARLRIDCTLDSLKKISAQHVRRFIKKYYTASNMFAIFMGPSFENAKELTQRYFADLPKLAAPILNHNKLDDYPTLKNIKSLDITRDIGQYYLAIAFPTEPNKDNETEAIQILADILSLRLYMRLRENNRNPEAGTYRTPVEISRSHIHGIIYPWFATISKDYSLFGESIILKELARLCNELVDGIELEAARKSLDNKYLDAFKNTPAILTEMVIESVCSGDTDLTNLHSFRNRLYKVTRRKLRDIANKYFNNKSYLRVTIGPN